jgi:uncharacterized protein YqeY
MKTISELRKERLTIRTTDPVRSMVLGLLIDNACKIAKNENREAEEKDIAVSAKRMFKETEKDIELIVAHGEKTSELAKELEVLKEFIPVLMDEASVRSLVAAYPPESLVKKNMGNLMKEMKAVENMDPSILSKVLNEVLK